MSYFCGPSILLEDQCCRPARLSGQSANGYLQAAASAADLSKIRLLEDWMCAGLQRRMSLMVADLHEFSSGIIDFHLFPNRKNISIGKQKEIGNKKPHFFFAEFRCTNHLPTERHFWLLFAFKKYFGHKKPTSQK